nr:uncharacterized protein CFP56_02835 [Quercus suber]
MGLVCGEDISKVKNGGFEGMAVMVGGGREKSLPSLFIITESNHIQSLYEDGPGNYTRWIHSSWSVHLTNTRKTSDNMSGPNGTTSGQGSLRLTVLEEPTISRPTSPYYVNRNRIVVFSGGSAANNLVDVFNDVREANASSLAYVIPISDNGGSSSELIRVFGGPGEYRAGSDHRFVSHRLTIISRARLFTGSFEAAIYQLSSICAVPASTSVLPALNTNFAHHIAAGLTDGTTIIGQNNISHPSAPTAAPVPQPSISSGGRVLRSLSEEEDNVEDANLPGSLLSLRKPALVFSKEEEEDLPARIDRLWYINPYGQEIKIPANPRVLEALSEASCIVYSIGSLYTSIIPSLVLRGVGGSISSSAIRSKILILNGTVDRETGPSTNPYTAMDFVAAIANACSRSRGLADIQPASYWQYVTHVIYIDSPSSPKLDRETFTHIGIETIRVYGPKDENGKGARYDAKALQQALEAIIGRKDLKGDKTRPKGEYSETWSGYKFTQQGLFCNFHLGITQRIEEALSRATQTVGSFAVQTGSICTPIKPQEADAQDVSRRTRSKTTTGCASSSSSGLDSYMLELIYCRSEVCNAVYGGDEARGSKASDSILATQTLPYRLRSPLAHWYDAQAYLLTSPRPSLPASLELVLPDNRKYMRLSVEDDL